jgi:hypothetical protein
MNVEYRRKAFYRFLVIKKTERSDSNLRNSAVRLPVVMSAASTLTLLFACLLNLCCNPKKALCHKKGLYVYTGGATPTSACGPADEHDDNFIDMEKLMNYTNK